MRAVLELDPGPGVDPPLVTGGGGSLSDPRMALVGAWWQAQVYEPFRTHDGALLPHDMVIVPASLDGRSTVCGLRFDERLLEDMLRAYGLFGWETLKAGYSRMTADGTWPWQAVKLYLDTMKVVSVLVTRALIGIEHAAVQFARTSWEAARVQLVGYRDLFSRSEIVGAGTEPEDSGPRIIDAEIERATTRLCRRYAVESAEAERLARQMNWRNQKVPTKQRDKGSGADLWYEAFAAPHREKLKAIEKIIAELHTVFPSAILVLGDLPVSVRELPESSEDPLAVRKAGLDLARAITDRITALVADLDGQLATVGRPRSTVWLEYTQTFPPPPIDLPEGGPEQTVLDIVLARTDKEQRLLANPHLLADLTFEDESEAEIWRRRVLLRYRKRLAQHLAEKARSTKEWQTLLSLLAKLAAALSILAFLAFFPFGAGAVAVAPLLVAALDLAAGAAFWLGLALMTVSVVQLLGAAGDAEDEARDLLHVLAQDDPDGLRAVGELLGHAKMLRQSLGPMFLELVVRIGVSKVEGLNAAFEVEGAVSDMESLLGPEG
ncbi:hypothetical protein O1Q96_01020 (plasmid) [Streptomyces sp. Qhu-G9]|uniref:hypothetical protein n=1 Tax=Streptomyces sp. Qhu-G9 TaxID=3452799 RepID=UPI0022AC4211|nr:hypothetical protein [Streptomyces aurantiacus]WAU78451.1 hypothetical protein O1Q96_01020 [Streptomyces aurantiacus]